MPNPLINSAFRGRNRTKTPQDHEEPTPPEIIGADVQVFPYRGTEDHGVPSKGIYTPPPDYSDTEFAEFEPEPPQPDPVPVRIVSQGAKELRQWTSHYVMAGSNPSLMLSRREDRISAKLINKGSVPILLAPVNSISVATGYPLAPGETFSTNSEAEVWGMVQQAGVGSPAEGWVNLFPMQVVAGAGITFGPIIPVRGATSIRLVHHITAATGTTVATKASLYAVNQDGVTIGGNVIGSTPTIGVATSMSAVFTPIVDDYIQVAVNNAGSSGDASVTSEVWGYIQPDYGTRDASQSLVLVYQEITVKE